VPKLFLVYNCIYNRLVGRRGCMKKIIQILNYFFIGFSFLASKKVVAILTVCLFIALLQVSTGYREELIQKEQEMMFEKTDSEVQFYNQKQEEIDKSSKDVAAKEVIQCLSSGINLEQVPDTVRTKIQELNQFYNSNQQYFSFLYQDLYTGFTVSYNEETPIFTASTIKAPAMIYLYEQASEGKIDLNEKLVYTANFYNTGSGVLKNKNVNTEYTVEQLIEYAIHDSDNIAYAMLMNRFGRNNMLNFWQNLGTKQIYTLNTIWGVTSAKDASIYMQELYRFYLENDNHGTKLMEMFSNAEWKMITNLKGERNTANKGGWAGSAIHDVAIVFEENPYILVIMSNTGEGGYMPLFQKTNKLVGEIHEAYWQYKEESCMKIKQY